MDTNPYAAPNTESEPLRRVQPAQRFSLVRVAIALAILVVTVMVIGIVHYVLMRLTIG